MAPYAFSIVGVGFLCFFTHLILRASQNKYDYLWYRQFWSFRRLPKSQKRFLVNYPFYQHLPTTYKRQFEHRVSCFIADKDFKHRNKSQVTDEQKVLIAAVACRLTFGRRSYLLPMLNTILIFDQAFKSPTNSNEHKGEYNPRAKVLAISWEDFKSGMDIVTDNLHLGLHEFTHVVHFESERSNDIDAMRYLKYHKNILRELMKPETRAKLDQTQFFRDYAFTNQYEFMAVLTEYFFESNELFKEEFPQMYNHLKKALLYNPRWIMA